MVLVDTLRADRLGTYGAERGTSPNIDRLAERGAVFLEARSTSTWTRPAVASLFTGHGPEVHGQEVGGVRAVARGEVEALGPGFTTLAEALRGAGYRTAAWVSNPHLSPATGLDRGFDYFDRAPMWGDGLVDELIAWLDAPGAEEGAWRAPPDGFDPARDRWFGYLHLMHPHLPYGPEAHDAERFPLPPGAPEPIPARVLERMGRQRLAGATDLRVYRARYDQAVHAADRQVGRALEALAGRGLLEETLVIVLSDHGEQLLEHGRIGHGHPPYDELLRVPLVVAYPPAVPSGRRIETPVGLLDLYPTLVDWLGLEAPGGPGESLLPLLTGRGELPERPHTTTHLPLTGNRKERVDVRIEGGDKLLYWPQRSRLELYDLDEDPAELVDRSAERADRARRLLAALRQERQRRAALAPATAGEMRTMPEEMLRELEALGYLDAEDSGEGPDR